MAGKNNRSGKINQANKGSLANNWETNTKTEDLALAESMLLVPVAPKEEINDEKIEDVIVYENGVTSIDFQLPEDEREVLERNLNNYSNMEKMKKALTMAKKNKILQEEVRSLDQLDKIDDFIFKMSEVLGDERVQEATLIQILTQAENGGDITKSIKQLGLTVKAFMDAREGLLSKMKAGKSGKNVKIIAKFTNDSGEDTELGVSIDG